MVQPTALELFGPVIQKVQRRRKIFHSGKFLTNKFRDGNGAESGFLRAVINPLIWKELQVFAIGHRGAMQKGDRGKK